jgi:tetratricopeptide (TPR) repeat protein
MDRQANNPREAKLRVSALIGTWVERTGYTRKNLAALAGLPEYNLFYKAYLDTTRPVSRDANYALGVIRAVTEHLPQERRATAGEVWRFLVETRFPHERIGEIAALFTPGEWEAASGQRASGKAQHSSAPALSEALTERLVQLEDALRRLGAGASEEEILAAATARLATMPDVAPAPAPLPVPHRMPFAPGRLFTGREEELSVLVRLLRAQQVGEAVAITGIGGIGKTSLASEVVHRLGRYFAGGVFWLSFAEPAQIPREMTVCGESGLVQHPGWATLTPEERVRLVSLAFQEPTPRLLIFDNCEEEAVLQQWRPTTGGCRVLLTSRHARWSRSLGVTTLALAELDQETSVTLLRRYRPELSASDEHLRAIARELGGLPLALHLAGSFLEVYQSDPVLGDPARLLNDLQTPGLLAHAALQGVDVAGTTTRHELHLGRTFAVSLERLDPRIERDTLARALLVRAACLAPGEPFPVEVLLTAANAADEGRPAVRRLIALGLLSESAEALRVHRLIQAFTRSTLDMGGAVEAVCRAIASLTERAYEQRDIPGARRLLAHALHLVNGQEPADPAAVELWNAVPFLLDMAGDLAGGVPYLERAHARLLSLGALETPLGGEVLNNLATWRHALGEGEEALPLHLQALAIRQRLFAPDSLTIAESHANIGDILCEQQDFEGARDHYEQALEIGLKSGGPTHNTTLVVRGQLALLHYHQRQFAQARDAHTELFQLHVATYGPDDPRTAIVRNNYAMALFQLGEVGEARRELDQGIAVLRNTLGDDHAETLRGRLNAARASVRLRAYQQAADELPSVISSLALVYGEESPITQLARDTLAEAEERLRGEGSSA